MLAHSAGCDYSNYRPVKVKLIKTEYKLELNINQDSTSSFYPLWDVVAVTVVVRVAKWSIYRKK